MRLIRCHIENFGSLHDLAVEFAPDFHLIAEPNGWGKSTLAAFVRVMFFGFGGEGKRSGTENERKRFEPWQGGPYGGQITFETGGRTYTASRIFSNKKSNDGFELRDAATNLKSTDFSENLGEEIFRINGESFARTVFIGQNDCVTAATDSINAKIGNLTDNTNDLDCYEKASAALQDAQNKLTPRRKTGALSRMNAEITRLETEVSRNAGLEDEIAEASAREEGVRRQQEENRRRQEELSSLSRRVSRARDEQAQREEYGRLCASCSRAEEACRQAGLAFPGEAPAKGQTEECMTACTEMDRAAEAMRIYELSEEERRQLSEEEYAAWDEPRTEGARQTGPGRSVAVICGAACCVLAAMFRESGIRVWIPLVAAGVVLIVIGLMIVYRHRRKEREELEERRREAQERESRAGALREKEQNFRSARGRYEESRSFVEERIRRMGRTPEVDLRAQVQEIWRQWIELQNAEKALADLRREKAEFEEGHAPRLLTEQGEGAEELPALEALDEQRSQLELEAEQIRGQAEDCRRRLENLRAQSDELALTRERLAGAGEERSRLRRQFDCVVRARTCLTAAREAMTAKYMEPLMRSFGEYYRIVTETPEGEADPAPDRFRMDANTNLTVEAYGMQRETAFLSRGYQDLTGLCLRLALVDAMYPEEKPFLILDDPLVSLDAAKTAGGKRLMEELMKKYQIIYFTCKEGVE